MALILIAEDDADIRRLLAKLLGLEGHKVLEADNGDRAMEVLRTGRPDLVILDVMMPRKDGYAVLKEMKALGLRERSKVLVLTARNAEADWLKGYRLGADGYVTKPFDPEDLVAAIDEVLEASPQELDRKREEELDRAQLLSRLESMFDGP